ncbi:MAG: response regulator [Trichocoleus desertorum ATA4-8-CV12]|jgi:two-component system response regulator|nr:response regulator [Trichocoleus desertorum ATA4-8-CV12]
MANQKILVIDDGKTIRMQVRDMLPQGSFEFLEAKDGVEGLDLIREIRPNIVLLDFFMPRMNGWEVLEQMQAQPELQSIPLVLMSGRKEEVVEKVPDLFDRFEFIEKPFGQKALIGALRSAIAKSRKPKPAAIATKPSPTATGTPSSAIPALNAKLDQMQTDIDSLKKQLAQITGFIKQKLK